MNARAIGDDEITQAEERFVLFPHGNIEKRVGADDEENAISGSMIGVAEIADGIDRIVELRAGKILASFGERWNEMRMLGAGQRNHGKAMGERREMLLQLMRRPAGGNEMNFVEIEAVVGGARDSEMAVVDGIERAAKQGDAAGLMPCCNAPLRLRGGQ